MIIQPTVADFGKVFSRTDDRAGDFSAFGSSWEKDGQNEIDIVGVNDLDRTVLIVVVKRKKTISVFQF